MSRCVNLGRAFSGGVNDQAGSYEMVRRQSFSGCDFRPASRQRAAAYLDQRLGHLQSHPVRIRRDGVYGDLQRPDRHYPLSDAVAASAAVPFAFAPIVVQAFPGKYRSAAGAGCSARVTNRSTRRRS